MNQVRPLVKIASALVALAGCQFVFAELVSTTYSTVKLVAENSHISSDGTPFNLGIDLRPNPGWHAYWINPGDAGKEPRANWTYSSDSWTASEFKFPAPEVIPFDTLITYGYNGPLFLISTITPPKDVSLLDSATIDVSLSWVVCDDQLCVPERAKLSISLPVEDEPPEITNDDFDTAYGLLPSSEDWDARFFVNADVVEFRVVPDDRTDTFTNPYLFIADKNLVQYDMQSSSQFNEGLFFTMNAYRWADKVDSSMAVLTFDDKSGERQAIELTLGKDDGSFVSVPVTQLGSTSTLSGFSISAPRTLLAAILAAFIGGILLNLMPCVFPILSLKAIHVVEKADSNPKENRLNGLLYTAGILVAFLIIGAVLLAIRASGMAVGWGFQLQSSLTNLILALLMVAIGLNLLGVYEIGTRLMGIGSQVTAKSDYIQNFLVGLLAVVVATPCVTPFMAPAIGWGFTQPAVVALGTLIALGLGLALPYLLICFIPAIAKALPRPGAWMDVFRQLLAFPMLLTAVWLFWVVGRQLGATSMAIGLVSALALALCLWAYGRGLVSSAKKAWYSLAVLGFAATISVAVLVERYEESSQTLTQSSSETDSAGGIEPFQEETLLAYIEDGQPAFVYFTADWCITCKVNERVALATDEVRDYFSSNNIRLIEADWTKQDETITRWLEKYERVGVPMYLYFPSGSNASNATVLPQILYPDLVIDLVGSANSNSTVAAITNVPL